MPELLGVVLCGGKSTRMGCDKGLIFQDGKTWAQRAHDLLAPLCSKVVYSINPQQLVAYETALVDSECVVDTLTGAGPLGGLLSVHEKHPQPDVLLLACDMIFIEFEDLHALTGKNAQIAAYRNAGIFEPLCAYYSAAALEKMSHLLSAGKIPMGLQRILHLPDLQVTALPPRDPGRLISRNEPS